MKEKDENALLLAVAAERLKHFHSSDAIPAEIVYQHAGLSDISPEELNNIPIEFE